MCAALVAGMPPDEVFSSHRCDEQETAPGEVVVDAAGTPAGGEPSTIIDLEIAGGIRVAHFRVESWLESGGSSDEVYLALLYDDRWYLAELGSAYNPGVGYIGESFTVDSVPSIDERKTEAEKIFDWGLSKFRAIEVYADGDKVGQARVWGGSADWVDLVTKGSFSVALTKEERKTAEVKLNYTGPLLAPVKAGDVVGTVKVFIEGRAVAELPVMTSTSVDAIESMWQKALDSAMNMAFGG